jgi:hypothetical protein
MGKLRILDPTATKPSDKMFEKCRTARKSYGKEVEDKKKEKEENDDTLTERRKVAEIIIREELEQWKENLEARSTFLDDESLELPPVKSKQSKQPKKVAKQSSSKTPTSDRNRVAAARVQVKRKTPLQAASARKVKTKQVEIMTEVENMITDVATMDDEL